jgi:hypothetical protein
MTLTYPKRLSRLPAITVTALGALALSACQLGSGGGGDFISDDPNAGDYGEEAGDGDAADTGGDAGDTSGGEGGDDNGGEVDITEADIVQMEGDLLYAISTYSGLTVVDMSNPDDLRALGTWETDAQPFEMYVDSGQAFVMFNDFGFWEYDDGLDEWSYNSSSRLVALDASNPANIEVEGEFTLPGRIQDSRRVGDVLYLVTMQDGYCWDCDEQQKTVVTSLDISDQANPTLVDQLEFTPPDSTWDWQRSVESTTERMYIAARSWNWEGGMGSLIDVVDISAGDGTLVPGAQVQVAGSVFSRWQMDEYQGVLRVISQFGWGDDPLVETFTVESSDSFVALGSGTLDLPTPESLRSARFDGVRAYAITAEQTDPLYTIDLSDPANPTQAGSLEIPGWVYHMETRDDRVLALGYDPTNAEGSINVSLFDVSTFDAPTLRRRVHFGGDWADFAEDQNRIHKAFAILDDEQMLLVPHTGWDYSDSPGFECAGNYRSGVQIIDWMDDDLTLRGVVPSRGRARRAFTHNNRIVTLSDVELATFDYSNRDMPAARDDLHIAVHVDNLVHAGDLWVRLGRNWWTSEQILEIVDADDPGAPEPIGEIDLGELAACEWAWVEGLYAVDDHVFVVQTVDSWDENYEYESVARVISVDISNPAAPQVDDVFDIPGQRGWGANNVGNVSTQSSWIAQHGDRLVVLTQSQDYESSQVHVVDLSTPDQLEILATLERPEGQTQGQLSILSDTVVSWHTEPVDNQPGKVRFYFDRLELDGPQPSWAPKINVPGIIVAYDADASRAFTVDFHISEFETDWNTCYEHPKFWRFDWPDNGEVGTCRVMDQTLERLAISGSGAELLETIELETEDLGLAQLYATDTRIFAKVDRVWWDGVGEFDGEYQEDSELLILDITANSPAVNRFDGEELGGWWSLTSVTGERAVVRANYGQLGLVDASAASQPEIQVSAVPGWGGCYRPVLDGDTVYCPMGAYGLETVEW